MSLGCCARYAEQCGGLFKGATGEEAELHDLGLLWMLDFERLQRLIQCQQIDGRFGCKLGQVPKFDPFASAAAFPGLVASGIVDQNPPHCFGGRGKKVAAVLPMLNLVDIDEPEIGLVDQGRGLKGLPRLLVSQPLRSQLAQLFIDQRQELVRGVRIAGFDCG